MSSEINLTGKMLASRSGKGRRKRAGTNLQADHGEKQAVSVQEVEHLRGTRVSGARAGAVTMGAEEKGTHCRVAESPLAREEGPLKVEGHKPFPARTGTA